MLDTYEIICWFKTSKLIKLPKNPDVSTLHLGNQVFPGHVPDDMSKSQGGA